MCRPAIKSLIRYKTIVKPICFRVRNVMFHSSPRPRPLIPDPVRHKQNLALGNSFLFQYLSRLRTRDFWPREFFYKTAYIIFLSWFNLVLKKAGSKSFVTVASPQEGPQWFLPPDIHVLVQSPPTLNGADLGNQQILWKGQSVTSEAHCSFYLAISWGKPAAML